MTVENCKRLLEHFQNAKEDRSLSEQARLNAKVAYEDMKANLAKRGVNVAEKKPAKK